MPDDVHENVAGRDGGDEIAVAGEALIDLVSGPTGGFDAHLGGGPYNAARSLARLGVPADLLGRLAGDDGSAGCCASG